MNSHLHVEDDGSGQGPFRWTTTWGGCEAKVDIPGVEPLDLDLLEPNVLEPQGNRFRFNLTEPLNVINGYSRRHYSGHVSFDPLCYDVQDSLPEIKNGVLTITVPRRPDYSPSDITPHVTGFRRDIIDMQDLDLTGDMGPVRWARNTQTLGVKVDVPGGCSGRLGTTSSPDRIEFNIQEFANIWNPDDVPRRFTGYVLYDNDVYNGSWFTHTLVNGVLTIRIPRRR